MKKLIAITFLLATLDVLAVDTETHGFIALDFFKVTKFDNQKELYETGIGVLDLKFIAKQDNLSGKIKLDLDNDAMGEKNNIFEEVLATYRFTPAIQITAGKGPVPFHHYHWGVIKHTYLDGGSVIGFYPKWSDVDRKIVTTLATGDNEAKIKNFVSFYGNSIQPKKDRDGNFEYDSEKKVKMQTSNTFSTKDERGFADKIEYYPNKEWTWALGGIYHKATYNPKENWALDFGANAKMAKSEFWFNSMYGIASTNKEFKYASYKEQDKTFQIGYEYFWTEKFSMLSNGEIGQIIDHQHNGTTVYTNQWKIEAGGKIKLATSAFLTIGALYETRYKKTNSLREPDVHALQLATEIAFWF